MDTGNPGTAWQAQMGSTPGAHPSVTAPVEDPEIHRLLGMLEEAVTGLAALDVAPVATTDRLALVCAAENTHRILTGASHTWLNRLVADSGFDPVLGAIGSGGAPHALATMLRITRRDAGARLALARGDCPRFG